MNGLIEENCPATTALECLLRAEAVACTKQQVPASHQEGFQVRSSSMSASSHIPPVRLLWASVVGMGPPATSTVLER